PATDQLLPAYSLTEGLTQTAMRRIFRAAVTRFTPALDEVFPEPFLQSKQLPSIHDALPQIHFPDNERLLAEARERFIYQELLVLQLAMAFKRQRNLYHSNAPALEASARIDARIRRLFPFPLTPGQQQAVAEIAADMARPHPMNRMLQGDVGSGKTVVALYAVLLTVAHGRQAVMMAPTEVLARQHERTLGEFLRRSQVRVALLSGSLTGKQRQETLERIAAGEVDVVIGTQAIVASGAQFHKLGLVVIDEQHKFGVRQRASLKQAGVSPHYLVMTATPIPRTVALSVFGDLEVTTLRDRPPGRQPLHTYFASEEHRTRWWKFVRGKLDEGRQAFVIAPLVEDVENDEAVTVEAIYENLANGELEAYRLGLLHGRLTPAAKEEVMQKFHNGEVQVLVSTSVVEVGVDVPNATLMAIEGAERFGLAQLHQLRGRITRGKHPGYCTLFGNPQTEESKRRLEAFCAVEDGFELAELDFQLRGAGDFFGVRQSGLPPLRVADLTRDVETVHQARRDAEQILTEDPGLATPAWAKLRKQLLRRYGEALDLGDVG
ncbi:MAG: ATP-dependent DNA helicase RecG, partial [Pirellulales bacterium]